MTRIVWDDLAAVHTGVEKGVIYPLVGPGVGWNGLTKVGEASGDTEEKVRYIDGVKTRTRRTRGEFSGTIEAYTYPDALYNQVLVQQRAQTFGLTYRIAAGDKYQLHLVYNVVIVPSDRMYQQRDPSTFQWAFSTLPIDIPFAGRSAHLILDGNFAYPWVLAEVEEILYGTDITDPRLPTPQEVWDIVEAGSILLVVDYGDGTFAIIGPDDAITITGTTFEVTWPSVINIDADTYQISSL
jgi:hypothetical protein